MLIVSKPSILLFRPFLWWWRWSNWSNRLVTFIQTIRESMGNQLSWLFEMFFGMIYIRFCSFHLFRYHLTTFIFMVLHCVCRICWNDVAQRSNSGETWGLWEVLDSSRQLSAYSLFIENPLLSWLSAWWLWQNYFGIEPFVSLFVNSFGLSLNS